MKSTRALNGRWKLLDKSWSPRLRVGLLKRYASYKRQKSCVCSNKKNLLRKISSLRQKK